MAVKETIQSIELGLNKVEERVGELQGDLKTLSSSMAEDEEEVEEAAATMGELAAAMEKATDAEKGGEADDQPKEAEEGGEGEEEGGTVDTAFGNMLNGFEFDNNCMVITIIFVILFMYKEEIMKIKFIKKLLK